MVTLLYNNLINRKVTDRKKVRLAREKISMQCRMTGFVTEEHVMSDFILHFPRMQSDRYNNEPNIKQIL